ncbi:GGDEF domain-containing protein [Ectopseudomonas mendocina]|uniref:diguanylate cyclase n=1 Tax=Ectopseudomonas mendocina TaxID=300 RepID=A0ABZ2RLP7_ECTME
MLSPPHSQFSFQSLLLRRFAMAQISYLLICAISFLATSVGLITLSQDRALLAVGILVFSQSIFLALFISRLNLRFKDPSLTLAQVLFGLFWVSLLLVVMDEVSSSLLVLYSQVLLFGLFQLKPKAFVGCALFAFAGFVCAHLYEYVVENVVDTRQVLVQGCILAGTLVWMTLFAHYVFRLRSRMRQRRHELKANQDALRDMMRKLENLAATDELTGLYNRRHFQTVVNESLKSVGSDQLFGIAVIDLDNFKIINDEYGHAAGDTVLQLFAKVAKGCLREGDVLARYGGEEFVLLLPNSDPDQLISCCERLRKTFNEVHPEGMKAGALSLSVGMTLLGHGDVLDSALRRADQALYRAKREGRNRCMANWGNAIA